MAGKVPQEFEPVDFDAVLATALRAGGYIAGGLAEEVRVRGQDGQWRRVWIPEPHEKADDDGLTPTRKRIVAALKAEARPISRKVLGLKVNRSARGGKFIQDVRFLLAEEAIFEGGGLLTDDRKKFAVTS